MTFFEIIFFSPRTVNVGFMVDKVELGEVSLRVLRIPPPVLITSAIYVPLPTARRSRNLSEAAASTDGLVSHKE